MGVAVLSILDARSDRNFDGGNFFHGSQSYLFWMLALTLNSLLSGFGLKRSQSYLFWMLALTYPENLNDAEKVAVLSILDARSDRQREK